MSVQSLVQILQTSSNAKKLVSKETMFEGLFLSTWFVHIFPFNLWGPFSMQYDLLVYKLCFGTLVVQWFCITIHLRDILFEVDSSCLKRIVRTGIWISVRTRTLRVTFMRFAPILTPILATNLFGALNMDRWRWLLILDHQFIL